jgi:AcrR family transcriptional regulator
MSGLRVSQKAIRRAMMLATASRLFDRRGYERTTINEIAIASRCGVATVYKYFKSKEGIVTALLEPDLDRILASAQRIIDAPPPDPAQAMVALLSEYRDLGGHNWSNRELLKMTIFPGVGNEGLLTPLVIEADARVHAQIRALLERFRKSGRLSPNLNLEDATSLVFAVFNQHFGMFLTQKGLKFAAMFKMLSRRVRLLYDDWRPRRWPRVELLK